MKTNWIPAIVMLTAGFIDCVLSICNGLPMFDFTLQLLVVLVVFYLLGCAIRIVLDMNFSQMDDEKAAEEAEAAEGSAEAVEETGAQQEGVSDQELENINSEEES